jgi:hypothetical protein
VDQEVPERAKPWQKSVAGANLSLPPLARTSFLNWVLASTLDRLAGGNPPAMSVFWFPGQAGRNLTSRLPHPLTKPAKRRNWGRLGPIDAIPSWSPQLQFIPEIRRYSSLLLINNIMTAGIQSGVPAHTGHGNCHVDAFSRTRIYLYPDSAPRVRSCLVLVCQSLASYQLNPPSLFSPGPRSQLSRRSSPSQSHALQDSRLPDCCFRRRSTMGRLGSPRPTE